MANMDHHRGLKEVRVAKQDLIGTMKGNLEVHRQDFEEQMVGWKKQYFELIQTLYTAMNKTDASIEEIEEAEDNLRDLDKPVSHAGEYVEVLELLEASMDDAFVLDVRTFNQYYRDKWNWSHSFELSNASYKV